MSSNREVLGVVLCPEAGAGEVLSIAIDTGEEILELLSLRYSSPNSVSVTDDGEAIVVAFTSGQVGVRTGDEWVEPSALSVGKSDHNDFQRGWAQVDPSGEFMVTRRDGDGVELWRVASSSDDPLARLAQYEFSEFYDPPDRVDFDDDVVSVSWSNPTSSGYLAIHGHSRLMASMRRRASWLAGRGNCVSARSARPEVQTTSPHPRRPLNRVPERG